MSHPVRGKGATLTPVSTSIPALSPVSENLVVGPTGTSVITKLELRVKMDESYVAATADPEEVAELIQAQVSMISTWVGETQWTCA
jgi:hypothetical protein